MEQCFSLTTNQQASAKKTTSRHRAYIVSYRQPKTPRQEGKFGSEGVCWAVVLDVLLI
jgi:hypothetical protein